MAPRACRMPSPCGRTVCAGAEAVASVAGLGPWAASLSQAARCGALPAAARQRAREICADAMGKCQAARGAGGGSADGKACKAP
mmetsp:Transcript_67164/g.216670  ORF Transcript_67164/g.216670 Transcript_67164/m.216670 type:complete len:84 (-) Transcript_67164:3-254(-)